MALFNCKYSLKKVGFKGLEEKIMKTYSETLNQINHSSSLADSIKMSLKTTTSLANKDARQLMDSLKSAVGMVDTHVLDNHNNLIQTSKSISEQLKQVQIKTDMKTVRNINLK